MSPAICVIDGNIGAGKSTLLDELQRRKFKVFKEPIEEWKIYLDLFYSDPKRWSCTVQMAILLSLEKQKNEMSSSEEDIVFVERSPDSSSIFTNIQKEFGFLKEEEFELVTNLYHRVRYTPDYVFFLTVDPETCLKRIKSRGRPCESAINLEYLMKLEVGYKNLVGLRIDGTNAPERIADEIFAWISLKPGKNKTEPILVDETTEIRRKLARCSIKCRDYKQAYEYLYWEYVSTGNEENRSDTSEED